MPSHSVEQGEHLSEIALKYGFAKYQTIWDHPQNAALKKKRVNPNVLFPGDVIFIPKSAYKELPCATGEKHKFVVPGSPPLTLRVIVRNRKGMPLADAYCELTIEGATYKLKTDGNGLIERQIPATAKIGKLRVPEMQIESPLKIGHLDPIDEQSGLLGRLRNLGYYRGPMEEVDKDELKSAIEEFQCDFGLKVDGDAGPKTQAKLKELHGC
jgi:N-acetylmuramoyl-L-alanine amidase